MVGLEAGKPSVCPRIPGQPRCMNSTYMGDAQDDP